MIERPILFDAPMVRAILAGTKTQTRRLVKPRHDWTMDERDDGTQWPFFQPYVHGEPEPVEVPCPYGAVGDRLWVRETWYCDHAFAETMGTPEQISEWREMLYFRADVPSRRFADADSWGEPGGGWKPSIHMPRFASRITLEVTDVRVERVQRISEEDARAEGVGGVMCNRIGPNFGKVDHRAAFARLWGEINGTESWASDPWVWVLGFRRVDQ